MGQYNLNRIFRPQHVAVVGASEKIRGAKSKADFIRRIGIGPDLAKF